MDMMTTLYIIFFATMALAGGVFILVIAGKDIMFALLRWSNKKGCDVYIANANRNISHYYRTPKEFLFKIKGIPYMTNPDKTENLTEKEKLRVFSSITKTAEKLTKKIQSLQHKKATLLLEIKKQTDPNILNAMRSEIENIDRCVVIYSNKLKIKTTFYFKDKRPAFFYIEGDPVPKDFFEYYSELDAKILDNIMARAITQPPEKYDEKQLKMLRYIAFGALIAGGIAALLAFQNSTQIGNLCAALEVTCK